MNSLILCAILAGCSDAQSESPEALVQGQMHADATPPPTSYVTSSAGPSFISEGAVNPRLLRRFHAIAKEGFGPLQNQAATDLGHQLFFDARLSSGNDVACSSCHDVAHGGADTRPLSIGAGGHVGDRNAPTVLNAAGAFSQFWDGRAASVEEQALVPLLGAAEMGAQSSAAIVQRLKAIPGYRQGFESAFPAEQDPVNFKNVGLAIAAYERRLSTPGRWDRFLDGDRSAMSSREKEGLRTFLSVGCMVCHTGPLVGRSRACRWAFRQWLRGSRSATSWTS